MRIDLGGFTLVSGIIPRDADYRLVGEKQTPLCKFGVKVDEQGADRIAVWLDCTCWRKTADVAKSFLKGDTVFAIGKIQTRQYQGREGDTRTATELVCEFVASMENHDSFTEFIGDELPDFPE